MRARTQIAQLLRTIKWLLVRASGVQKIGRVVASLRLKVRALIVHSQNSIHIIPCSNPENCWKTSGLTSMNVADFGAKSLHNLMAGHWALQWVPKLEVAGSQMPHWPACETTNQHHDSFSLPHPRADSYRFVAINL